MRLIAGTDITDTPKRVSLTAKQEAFAQYIANGMSQIDAYCRAYGHDKNKVSKAKRDTYDRMAWQLASNPKIIERVDCIRNREDGVDRHDPMKLREFVLEKLQIEANNGDNSSARIRALELLGKVGDVGLFVEKVEQTSVSRTPEQVETELKQRLKALAGGK